MTAEGPRAGSVTSTRQRGGEGKKGRSWSVMWTWMLPQTVNIDWGRYRPVQRTAENWGWCSKEERSGKGGAHFRGSLLYLKMTPQEGYLAIPGHALPIPPSTLQVLGYWLGM